MEYNFIIDNGNLHESEVDVFFGGDVCEVLSDDVDFLDILVKCKIFPSKGQARKAGRESNISIGYNEFVIGKLKTRISILKPVYYHDVKCKSCFDLVMRDVKIWNF